MLLCLVKVELLTILLDSLIINNNNNVLFNFLMSEYILLHLEVL